MKCAGCPRGIIHRFVSRTTSGKVSIFHVFSYLGRLDRVAVSVSRIHGGNGLTRTYFYCAKSVVSPGQRGCSLGCCASLTGRVRGTNTGLVTIGSVTKLLGPRTTCTLITTLGSTISLPVRLRDRRNNKLALCDCTGTTRTNISVISITANTLSGNADRPSVATLCCTLRGGPHRPGLSVRTLRAVSHC